MKTAGIFEFGEFRVDALARTLRREEEPVMLNRRAFDVLLYLVENPGRSPQPYEFRECHRPHLLTVLQSTVSRRLRPEYE